MDIIQSHSEELAPKYIFYGAITLSALEKYLDERHEAQLLNEITTFRNKNVNYGGIN
jgi:hypothetical protein